MDNLPQQVLLVYEPAHPLNINEHRSPVESVDVAGLTPLKSFIALFIVVYCINNYN